MVVQPTSTGQTCVDVITGNALLSPGDLSVDIIGFVD
jgi:hypothetical protein